MKQKKIIVFMPSVEGGGVEKNFFIITNYLAKKFNEVSVICLSKNSKKNLSKKIKFVSLNNRSIKFLGRRIKFIISLILLFKEIIINRNSTVFCFQGIVYCTILCKIFSTKIVIRSNSSPSGWSNNFIKQLLYKYIYGLADLIIVNSYEFKKEFKKKFNLKSICIYNPLNKLEILNKAKKKIKLNFFNKEKFKIISVARFSKQKDHACLIKAIQLLNKSVKNVRLLMIGSGSETKKIQNLINELELNKIAKILSFKENPFPYIKKADLFILSSNFEGLPNVLLEAIVLNKFVISSNCPTGPSEILDHGKGGLLFKVGDHKSLYKKILIFRKNKKNSNNKKIYANKRLYRFDKSLNLSKYYEILAK